MACLILEFKGFCCCIISIPLSSWRPEFIMVGPETRPPRSRYANITSASTSRESPEQIRAWHLSYVEKEIKFFENLSKFAIGIGTFGGSITFSLIITDIREPTLMTRSTVQSLLAVSWLLFIVALGFASVTASLLDWYGERIKYEFQQDNGQRKWLWYDGVFSIALGVSLLGAFLVASIVVMAYASWDNWNSLYNNDWGSMDNNVRGSMNGKSVQTKEQEKLRSGLYLWWRMKREKVSVEERARRRFPSPRENCMCGFGVGLWSFI